jgi:hypothetical protein
MYISIVLILLSYVMSIFYVVNRKNRTPEQEEWEEVPEELIIEDNQEPESDSDKDSITSHPID